MSLRKDIKIKESRRPLAAEAAWQTPGSGRQNRRLKSPSVPPSLRRTVRNHHHSAAHPAGQTCVPSLHVPVIPWPAFPFPAGKQLRRVAALILLSAAFAAPMLARAADSQATVQPPDLAEVPIEKLMEMEIPHVYGASKFEQKETEAPSLVTVITADDIKKYGYRTLADALRTVPGFYVSYDRNYAFLGAGGVNLGDYNSRILLVVNGHRMNSDLTDGAHLETAFILDVDLIDRIEVIQGPGAVLYGDNAFFGVINVITRQGQQLDGAEVSGEYGGFDTYKGRVSYGKKFNNGAEVLVSGSIYDSAGPQKLFYKEYNTPAQNNGIAEGLDTDNYKSGFGSLNYGDFTLEGAFIERDKGNPTAQYFTTFNDSRLHTIDDRGYVNLTYAHSFPDVVDVKARLFYDYAKLVIRYPIGGTVFRETDRGDWWGTDVQLTRRVWDRHVLTAGAEYRDDFEQARHLYSEDTGQTFTAVDQNRQIYGVFGQADVAVLTNLHVNAGVRYDHSGDFSSAVSPRAALLYSPVPISTFKFTYGTAFRAPNFLELSDPRFQNLEPEKITSYQLVYEQQLGAHFRSTLAGFINDMHNLIVLESGSYTNYDVEGKGIEAGLEAFWAKGVRARASYTLQHTRNTSIDQGLPDSPQHLAKVNVSVPLYKDKIFASAEFQYVSSRHTLFTTDTGETLAGLDTAGFGVVNLTLFSRELVKNLEFSAGIYNLLDKHYADPASRFHLQDTIEQDGRSFRLKITYHF